MTKKRFLLTNYGYGCKIFMLLVNTTLYGGTIMDGRNINFDRSIRNLLLYSNIISKKYKVETTTSLIAIMKGTPINRYLLKNNMNEEEISRAIQKLFDKYLAKNINEEAKKYYSIVVYEQKYNISWTLYEIIESINYDKNHYIYLKHKTNDLLHEAFMENLPDIYLEFITICLGEDAILPPIIEEEEEGEDTSLCIPRELVSCITIMNNEPWANEDVCRILGRKSETEQLEKILAKATKRNAILIGEPGVGKTAIIEKLTWSITTENCHNKFKNAKILALDVNSIIAGTKYRGMAEERFQVLVEFLELHPECILFIDEIHTILGAGASKIGELDLANVLKPILSRGKTQVIGATTSEEYKKYFSSDGALKRRFEKIIVKEPRADEVYDMIKNQIAYLSNFHGTKIDKEVVEFAILNASCFNYETKNPDRTLDLIDRSMAGAELKGKNVVEKADILDNFVIRRKQFDNMTTETKMATAYHEAGHYIIKRFATKLQNLKTLAISIMPAEEYLGINVYEVDENITPSNTREAFIQRIAYSLGGRIAEQMYTRELSAGASSDLIKATNIAQNMVTRYGLGSSTNRVFLENKETPIYSTSLVNSINEEVNKILKDADKYAEKILKEHQKELEILVDALIEKGILSSKEIEEVFEFSEELVEC